MARGADPLTFGSLFSSAAAPKTTKTVVAAVDSAKSDYFKNKVNNTDSKKLFKVLDGLLNIQAPPLDAVDDPASLAETLAGEAGMRAIHNL